ncbi:hypothetical protein, partial [Phyllobacterium zundukense]|uniref:hypothetical protein n=1 Tax=Phyllobacterium zundukense TaxID=1867719 RepID=UPI001A9F4A08
MSVIILFGTSPCFLRSLVSNRFAALVLRRFWTISSGDVRLNFQVTRMVALLISGECFCHGFPLCHGIQAVEINLACR